MIEGVPCCSGRLCDASWHSNEGGGHPSTAFPPIHIHTRPACCCVRRRLQSVGGQFIWVAPSGGRDRPDPETGKFVVSPYDPKSVEVFRLMAAKAKGREGTGPATHFFPFAMWTNKLVPPPDQVSRTSVTSMYHSCVCLNM